MMLLDRGELRREDLVGYIGFCWITGSRNIPQISGMLCCFVADEMSASNSLNLGETTSGGGSSLYSIITKGRQLRLLKGWAEESRPKGTMFLQLPLTGSGGCLGGLCLLMDLAITLVLPVTIITSSESCLLPVCIGKLIESPSQVNDISRLKPKQLLMSTVNSSPAVSPVPWPSAWYPALKRVLCYSLGILTAFFFFFFLSSFSCACTCKHAQSHLRSMTTSLLL